MPDRSMNDPNEHHDLRGQAASVRDAEHDTARRMPWLGPLCQAIVVALLGFLIFESVKDFCYPELTKVQSRGATVFFAGCFGALGFAVVWGRLQQAHREVLEETIERRRLEESRARAIERASMLEQANQGLAEQIRHRERAEAELHLLREIALEVGNVEDPHEALAIVLRRIGGATGWDLGQAWVLNASKTCLVCSPAWYQRSAGLDEFRHDSERRSYAPGVGVPGSIWNSKQLYWAEDLQAIHGMPRKSAARQAGLVSMVGIPILAQGLVVAVLEFFVRQPCPQDEQWTRVITTIATQIGAILQRKEAEAALHKSERLFRAVSEQMPDGLLLLTMEGATPSLPKIIEANDAVCRMHGFERDDLLTKSIVDLTGPDSEKDVGQIVARVLAEGAIIFESVHFRKDGSSFPIEVSSRTIELAGKKLFISLMRDITERKRAAAALQQERDFLNTLLENLSDGIVACDAAGTLTIFNRATRLMHGLPVLPLPAEQWAEHYDLYQADGQTRMAMVDIPLFRALQGEHVRNVQMVISTKQGNRVTLLASGEELTTPEGHKFGAVVVMRDITERVRAEDAARHAQEELLLRQSHEKALVDAELTKVRGELVRKTRLAVLGQMSASIAHELRNPLGAIRNATYLLRRRMSTKEPKTSEMLDIIEQEVMVSDRIIGNLLDTSRAKQPVKASFDLDILVHAAIARANIPKEVRCHFEPEKQPFRIVADAVLLRQVIDNLLKNALDAIAGSGDIYLAVLEADLYYEIWIRDSGPGVSVENRASLFDPLFSTKAKGTGLGLWISRQIIERHEGSIDLIDEPGYGAVFRIRLPRQAPGTPYDTTT